MDPDGYFMLVQNIEQCQVSDINSGYTGMMGSREPGVGSRPLGNVELMMGSRESGPSTSWAIDQQHKPDAHIKSHECKLIAGKSIVIYDMTWEALSPSPFTFTLSGLTRLG